MYYIEFEVKELTIYFKTVLDDRLNLKTEY